jgi:hypothetical protein
MDLLCQDLGIAYPLIRGSALREYALHQPVFRFLAFGL